MKIKEVLSFFEKKYPLSLQESFDNSGIQCGNVNYEITGAMVCFDVSLDVVEEAIEKNANLILSHHPLIFGSGLKKIQPTDRVGKILCKAIENKIVIYSMHTNLDSAVQGVNTVFADKLGLSQQTVLAPQPAKMKKIVFFVPKDKAYPLKEALFQIGCGKLGSYSHCSYSMQGAGSFLPLDGANPFIGKVNQITSVDEERVEMVFPDSLQKKIVEIIYQFHPYEEPAFDIINLENYSKNVGLGKIGILPKSMELNEFLLYLKTCLDIPQIKYSGHLDKEIRKVALCGGSGASFIKLAQSAGADAYISGDFKYHDFFEHENKIYLVDIGHYEGEHFIRENIYNDLKENFITFAHFISEREKKEISYL